MSFDNKWTIDELLARYELEPELLDVFVEGAFDRELLSQHNRASSGVRTFYEIDAVDVPAKLLALHGYTTGNKQRVIALSIELARAPAQAQVLCLVDRDLDHWFGTTESKGRLRWSVFCSIESHFLTKDTIRDIAVTTSRSKIGDLDIFFDSLLDVLRQLYSLRLADRELGLNLRWIAIRKYLSRNSDAIVFDLQKYAFALLNSSSMLKHKGDFVASADNWLLGLTGDIRLASRGHDYTALLAWAIAEFDGHKEFASVSAIERLFVLLARSSSSLGSELQ